MKIVKFASEYALHVVIVFLFSTLIFSCARKSELANHIPKDANLVVAFDIKSMGLKSVDFKALLSFDNMKKVMGSLGKKDSLHNFQNSGIDFLNKAFFFMKTSGQGQHYGVIIMALSDAEKFEGFTKTLDQNIQVIDKGNFKMASLEDAKSVIGWTSTEVMMLYGGDDAEATMAQLITLEKGESLVANNDTFKSLANESADIVAWVSFENLQQYASGYGAAMANLNLKETFMTATCNFEDGQIAINSQYRTNKETASKFDFIRGNISRDVANAMPGKTVIGLLGLALDMDNIYNYLEREKLLEPYAPSATMFTGLTIKEFFTMLSGDVAVSVNGIEMKEVTNLNWATGEQVVSSVPNPEYYAVLGIANKTLLSKLLTHFTGSGLIKKNSDHYAFQDKLFLIDKGNFLIITGSESMKQSGINGSFEQLNNELSGMLTSNASAFYLNPSNIPETFYATGSPLVGYNFKNTELKDVLITSATARGNVTAGKMLIRFNKNENSLLTLTNMSKKYAEWIQETVVSARANQDLPQALTY